MARVERARLARLPAVDSFSPLMPGSSSQDLFQQATDLFAQRVTEYSNGIANRLGQPLSGSQLNKDQVLQRWNFSPLGDTQTADAHYHDLVAQGMPPGQALDQVYPFRKLLFSGPDLKSQIDTAQQIAGWDASARGTEPPKPDPHALPLLHMAQSVLGQGPQQLSPAPPPPVPSQPAVQGPIPPGMMPPAGPPGEMPPVSVGSMPPVQPVPGLG